MNLQLRRDHETASLVFNLLLLGPLAPAMLASTVQASRDERARRQQERLRDRGGYARACPARTAVD
jgi:hypothetical protein